MSGPLGGGKCSSIVKCLQETQTSFRVLEYAQLLQQNSALFESPRIKAIRFFEGAELDGVQVVVVAHVQDFFEDGAVWCVIKEHLSHSTRLRLIGTIEDRSRLLPLMTEFFTLSVSVDSKAAEGAEIQKIMPVEKVTEEEARRRIRFSSVEQKEIDLTRPSMFGIPKRIKSTLLSAATFQIDVRGILLFGPPGTGKTKLAAGLASTLKNKLKVINLSSADLIRAEVGTSEQRLRDAFKLAKASTPSMLFLDEVESLFPASQAGHLSTLLDQIVAEFDSLAQEDEACQVFVLAATNFPEKVNPRLLQAGRLEIQLEIGVPDTEGRREIFEGELLRRDDTSIAWNTFSSTFMDDLVAKTGGKTPAELVKIVEEARRRSQDNILRMEHFK